jgi:hypothetical protein
MLANILGVFYFKNVKNLLMNLNVTAGLMLA